MNRWLLLIVAPLALAGGCGGGLGGGDQAERVYERTKNMRGTWASYTWNWMRLDGQPREAWSAEFHRDNLHRVETPEWRIVADCSAGTGTVMSVATNERVTGPRAAAAACGIESNSPVLSKEYIGSRGSHGAADIVKIVDPQYDRFYAVNPNGVIIASEIFAREGGTGFCLQAETTFIEHTLPEDEIFSEASLARSVVPDRYRTSPGAAEGALWLSGHRCS